MDARMGVGQHEWTVLAERVPGAAPQGQPISDAVLQNPV
jgi:hypothetical protein